MCQWGNVVETEINGKSVAIDACLFDLVSGLNASGIATKSCCCGHGKTSGSILLEDGRVLVIYDDFDTWLRTNNRETRISQDKTMVTRIWYSVENCGDGSAYPKFMESEELAVLDQRYMDEGWGECCCGCLLIDSDGPIKVNGLITVDDVIQELEEELNEDYMKEDFEHLESHLREAKSLKERSKD